MSVDVKITVEDIATKIATYTKIELERAATAGGSYSEITEITLVAGDYYYEYTDTGGSASSFYRYRFSNAAETVRSDYSSPWSVGGATLRYVRQLAIEAYDAGLVLTATGGSTTTFVATNYRVLSTFYPSERAVGTWIHISDTTDDAAPKGETSVVTTYAPSTGTFTLSPAITTVGAGDEGEWHWLADPDTWNRMIRRAQERHWYIEKVPIVGVDDQYEYDLSDLPWLTNPDYVTAIRWKSESDDQEEEFAGSGRWWRIVQDGYALTLHIYPAITTDSTLYLYALRTAPPLWTDDSALPEGYPADLLAALAYDEVMKYLTQVPSPAYGRERLAEMRKDHHPEVAKLLARYAPKIVKSPPQPAAPASVYVPWTGRG